MPVKNLYMSRVPSCKYAFLNGKEANFINHEYYTDLKNEITELDNEIALRHPTLYVDLARKTVDTTKIDPVEEIRAKAIAEYVANQAKVLDKTNDRGVSISERLNVSTSANINAAMAGSSSGQTAPVVAK